MTRILVPLILAFAATGVSAGTWPWEQPSTVEPSGYCTGFVSGGLDSRQVEGMSRVDLWLAWSYVIRSGALNNISAASEIQAGREQFQKVADKAAAQSVLDEADGNCGLGRSGHQITGW